MASRSNTPISVAPSTRDTFAKLKRQLSAEAGEDVTADDLLLMLMEDRKRLLDTDDIIESLQEDLIAEREKGTKTITLNELSAILVSLKCAIESDVDAAQVVLYFGCPNEGDGEDGDIQNISS